MTKRKTTSVRLDASELLYLARAVLPAVSAADVTPALSAAHLYTDGNQLHAIGADRYRVHLVHIKLAAAPREDISMLMPRETLLWITRNAPSFTKRGTRSTATIAHRAPSEDATDYGSVKVTLADEFGAQRELSFMRTSVRGNFPPVEKLFEAARSAPESAASWLNLDFLASVRPMRRDFEPARIKYTEQEISAKPGPALIQFKQGDVIYAEALIQPNLGASA